MSHGFFFAYASQAGCRQSRPDWFAQDPDTGEWFLTGPRVLISERGVWLTRPEGHWSVEPDPETGEGGEWTETVAGVRSENYVVLSPENDGSEDKLIEPADHQGFA